MSCEGPACKAWPTRPTPSRHLASLAAALWLAAPAWGPRRSRGVSAVYRIRRRPVRPCRRHLGAPCPTTSATKVWEVSGAAVCWGRPVGLDRPTSLRARRLSWPKWTTRPQPPCSGVVSTQPAPGLANAPRSHKRACHRHAFLRQRTTPVGGAAEPARALTGPFMSMHASAMSSCPANGAPGGATGKLQAGGPPPRKSIPPIRPILAKLTDARPARERQVPLQPL